MLGGRPSLTCSPAPGKLTTPARSLLAPYLSYFSPSAPQTVTVCMGQFSEILKTIFCFRTPTRCRSTPTPPTSPSLRRPSSGATMSAHSRVRDQQTKASCVVGISLLSGTSNVQAMLISTPRPSPGSVTSTRPSWRRPAWRPPSSTSLASWRISCGGAGGAQPPLPPASLPRPTTGKYC